MRKKALAICLLILKGELRVWKRFVQALDQARLSPSQKDEVIQGALDAFEYFGNALINLEQLH